jgi:hypothetical protein
VLDAHGPYEKIGTCPTCTREAALVWTRLDWPEPPTPQSNYARVCRSCVPAMRRHTNALRGNLPAATLDLTFRSFCESPRPT